jgi:tRNA(Ile)-lysidine synthase
MSAPVAALRRAAATGLLPPGRPLLLACSGGLDSMALACALVAEGRWPVRAATVDHGLHTGSDEDAAFVVRALARWGVSVTVLRADPERVRAGEGPEDGARRERYRLLEAHRSEPERLVTAHTADDQAETLIMRLAHGAGVRGMGGIAERRGAIARPWLAVTRAEVAAFAAAQGLEWREDPTNAEAAYLRNRVRHRVAPVLGEVFGAGWARAASRTAGSVRADLDALDYLIEGWRAAVIRREVDGLSLDLAALEGAPSGLRRMILRDALATLEVRDLHLHVSRVESLVGGAGVRRLSLPRGLQARRAYGRVHLGPAPDSRPAPAPLMIDGPGAWSWGERTLVVEESAGEPEPTHVYIDREAAPFPWRVRGSLPGERYRPLGAPGAKKITRLWMDARVPRAERSALPVVEAAGRLVWVAPLRVADDARVRPGAPAWRVRLEGSEGTGRSRGFP